MRESVNAILDAPTIPSIPGAINLPRNRIASNPKSYCRVKTPTRALVKAPTYQHCQKSLPIIFSTNIVVLATLSCGP